MTECLLPLSGGLDSTYLAWRLAREGWTVHAVHVNLSNKWERTPLEAAAVEASVPWINDTTPGTVNLTGCAVDYGTTLATSKVRTIEVARYLAAFRLRNLNCDVIAASGIADDGELHDDRRTAIHRAAEAAAGKQVWLMRAIRHLTKLQIVADMPDELRAMCWWCDHPRNGNVCGRCQTCRQVRPALRRLDPDRPTGVASVAFGHRWRYGEWPTDLPGEGCDR